MWTLCANSAAVPHMVSVKSVPHTVSRYLRKHFARSRILYSTCTSARLSAFCRYSPASFGVKSESSHGFLGISNRSLVSPSTRRRFWWTALINARWSESMLVDVEFNVLNRIYLFYSANSTLSHYPYHSSY